MKKLFKDEGIKLKFMKKLQKVLFVIAIFAAATPSQVGSYQKKCPKSLEKYHF